MARRALVAALLATTAAAAAPPSAPPGHYVTASPDRDYVVLPLIPGLEVALDPAGRAAAAVSSPPLFVRPCPRGTFCARGAAHLCPAGTFGGTPASSSPGCDGACEGGFWCPPGSTAAAPPERACGNASWLCPPGSCRPTPVTPGHYTLGGRTTASGGRAPATGPEVCRDDGEPGVYGGAAARPEAPTSVCVGTSGGGSGGGAGGGLLVSLPGEARPVPVLTPCGVPRSPLAGAAAAPGGVPPFAIHRACAGPRLGDADTRSAQAQCEPGAFCWKGWRFLCAPGRYGAAAGETSALCSGLCPAGFACPAWGTAAPRDTPCGGPRVYCPPGTAVPLPVDRGYYTDPAEPPAHRTRQLLCPRGSYCPGNGLAHACPPGTFGGDPGAATPACGGPCAPGFYCPAGSTSARQVPCGAGGAGAAVFCPAGSGAPTTVSPGYWTQGGYSGAPGLPHNTTRVQQRRCPQGWYCAGGVAQQCPAGRFGGAPGLATPACSGGCAPGHFCPPGSTSPTPHRCGDVFLFFVDALAALRPPGNDSWPAHPPPDLRNPGRSLLDPAAGYDYAALYALYGALVDGGAVVTGAGGSNAGGGGGGGGSGLAAGDAAAAPAAGAGAAAGGAVWGEAGNVTVPLLRPSEVAGATSRTGATPDGRGVVLEVTLPMGGLNASASWALAALAALGGGGGGGGGSNTTGAGPPDVLLVAAGVAPSGAPPNLTLSLGHRNGSAGAPAPPPPSSGGGGGGGGRTLTIVLPASIPWESRSRSRLPPLAVPVDSFAALHRLLLVGGPSAVYCPPGSGWPLPAPAGHYTRSAAGGGAPGSPDGNVTCDAAAPGEPGSFAVAGVLHPCHAGTYGARPGEASRHCSGPCPAGHACPGGTAVPQPCPDGTYAPRGSARCLPCPAPSTLLAPAGGAWGRPADADDPGAGAAFAVIDAATGTDAGHAMAASGGASGGAGGGAARQQRCKHSRDCCGL